MIRSRSVSPGRPVLIAGLLLLAVCSGALARTAPGPRQPNPALRSGPFDIDFLQNIVVGEAPCDDCQTQVCAGEPVEVTVSGLLPSTCYRFLGLRELVELPFPAVAAEFFVDTCECISTLELSFFTGHIYLPPEIAGFHSLSVRAEVRTCPDSLLALTQEKTVSYTVLDSCPPPPPPPPPGLDSLLRSFVRFEVAPQQRCPNDSLALLFLKNDCPPCLRLTSLEPDSEAFFHATFDWQPNCLEFACIPETLSMPIGRLVPGFYSLTGRVDAHVLSPLNGDTTVTFETRVSFEVPRTCSTTTTPCMQPFLIPNAVRSACTLSLRPGATGELTLSAFLPVPLGGFQGRIDVSPPFQVLHARAPDFLTGLHVVSRPDGRGVTYLAFTDPDHPLDFRKGPVLEVDVTTDPGTPTGTTGSMFARVTVASDPDGGDVPICQVIPLDLPLITLCVSDAADSCDANGDGHADVRDLVLMTHCFRPIPVGAQGSSSICRDCNGDGQFTFDDLFCCARFILRGPLVPGDSVHAVPGLHVSFDPPQPSGDALYVRVHVTGADGLGAAQLRLTYPAARWQASEPGFIGPGNQGPVDWFTIADVEEPGTVQLGGLRLGETAHADLVFTLIFTPTATPLPSDRIQVEAANLAAPDGTVMTPMSGLPALTLDATQPPESSALELSPGVPNPFTTSTKFSVNLPRTAQVDLSVHDLAGRRIATVAHGVYGAGRRSFWWDGANARDGLYFVRLSVDGRVLSTRVALLRNGP